MLRVHQPPKPSAGCHPWTWASCRILLPRPPSSWSRERVCSQVSSVPGRAWRKPLWSEGWCGMERVRCCLEASLVLRDRRTLSSPAHQGLWGEGYPLTPPPTSSFATATLTVPTVEGQRWGRYKKQGHGAGLWHNPAEPGPTPPWFKGGRAGKISPSVCLEGDPGLLPALWLLKLFPLPEVQGAPQGSQTLSTIGTRALLSLEGLENLVEGIPAAPVSSTGVFLHPPTPKSTHIPQPPMHTRTPTHERTRPRIPPGETPRQRSRLAGTVRLRPPEHPPAPRLEGDRGCTASPGAQAGQRSTF